ncbi:hypothetical protein [Rhizobium sp. RCAM05973]|uniref:hypothetical protein n=1 Tax=Rhizobium sp. RCAM05973 TaxID=2994066 RepID=UPI0022EBBEBE|nr:hypothetical protein [Rhizobium sp. RCAM05973]
MVVLDNGFFSSFDCGQRMGTIFLVTFLAQVGIVARLAVSVRWPGRGRAVEMIDDRPFFTRRRFVVSAIWCVFFVMVSGVCSSLRTITTVFLDAGSIVETSCNGPFRDEYRLDRARLNISFDHDPTWLSKRPLKETYLIATQAGKPRPIYIHLAGRPVSAELSELAPKAMADYFRYRASLGFR